MSEIDSAQSNKLDEISALRVRALAQWPDELARGLWHDPVRNCQCAVGHLAVIAGATIQKIEDSYSINQLSHIQLPQSVSDDGRYIGAFVGIKYGLSKEQLEEIIVFSDHNYDRPRAVAAFVSLMFKFPPCEYGLS